MVDKRYILNRNNDIEIQSYYNLYNNKCFVVCLSAAPELMRACDGSLEPSWHKNDGSMENFRFARAARPQCAKMCFLLHKAPLNSCLEGCNANMIVDNLGKLTFPK